MAEPTSDKHYEDDFEFTLWHMIKDRAEEKDTSYHDAIDEVLPEFEKDIRYRDKEFENEKIQERHEERVKLSEHRQRLESILKGE